MTTPVEEDRKRIRNLIIRVGEDRRKIPGNIKGLCAVLVDDMEVHRDTIILTAVDCIKNIPTRSGVFGTWIALMNENFRVFVHDCIQAVHSELQQALEACDMNATRLLVRHFIELANSRALRPSAIFKLLHSILSKPNDFTSYLVLTSILHISPEISKSFEADIEKLVTICELHASNRVSTFLSFCPNIGSAAPVDGLTDLLLAVRDFQAQALVSLVIVRPYVMEGLVEKVNSLPEELMHAELPDLDDSVLNKLSEAPPLHIVAVSRLAPISTITLTFSDMWLLRDVMNQTIDCFSAHLGECGRQLLRIPVSAPEFEAVLADVILSRLLGLEIPSRLPRLFYVRLAIFIGTLQTSFKAVYQAALLHLVSDSPAGSVGFAVAEALAMEISQSKFEFDLGTLSIKPENTFVIRAAMDFLLQLSFHHNVMQKVPAALHAFMPAQPAAPAEGLVPEPESAQGQFYRAVKEQVKARDGDEAAVAAAIRGDDQSDRFSLFFLALLENGSKTPAHLAKLAEGFSSTITAFGSETVVVDLIQKYWALNSQRRNLTIMVFVQLGIISLEAVLRSFSVSMDSVGNLELATLLVRVLLSRYVDAEGRVNEAFKLRESDPVTEEDLAVASRRLAELLTAMMAANSAVDVASLVSRELGIVRLKPEALPEQLSLFAVRSE